MSAATHVSSRRGVITTLPEQCDWKGKRKGNVGVHKDQSLVLVNYGNGTGEEIINLAKEIQQSVVEKFNIFLTPEVNII